MSRGLGTIQRRILGVARELAAGHFDPDQTWRGRRRFRGHRFFNARFECAWTDAPDDVIDIREVMQVCRDRFGYKLSRNETWNVTHNRALHSLIRRGCLEPVIVDFDNFAEKVGNRKRFITLTELHGVPPACCQHSRWFFRIAHPK